VCRGSRKTLHNGECCHFDALLVLSPRDMEKNYVGVTCL
jgi:hypothetical protein